jgi:uncharacterized protein (DUF58 family)
VRLRPTELGLKGSLLGSALGVAFFASGYSNLFFLLLAFVVVLGVLGALWTVTNLRGSSLHAAEPPFAAAGQARTWQIELRLPRGRAAAFDLSIGLELGGSCHELLHVPLARSGERFAVNLPGLPRGQLATGRWHVRSRHPFGLWRAVRTLPCQTSILTYPQPAPFARLRAPQEPIAVGVTGTASTNAAAADDVAGLRPFRPGDAVGRIHWRATARRGEPVVRENQTATDDTVEVWVDRRCEPAALEPRLAAAAAAVLTARRARRALTLRSQAVVIASDGSTAQSDAQLRWLATAAPLPVPVPTDEAAHG